MEIIIRQELPELQAVVAAAVAALTTAAAVAALGLWVKVMMEQEAQQTLGVAVVVVPVVLALHLAVAVLALVGPYLNGQLQQALEILHSLVCMQLMAVVQMVLVTFNLPTQLAQVVAAALAIAPQPAQELLD
jgi:hypothetical protein